MTEQGHDRLRASHADRERAIDVLKAAFAEGRLDTGEFTDRVGQVQVSRTYADLGALIADLPVGPFGTLAPAPPAGVGAGPLPLPAPPPEESRLRPPPRTSMTPLVIAALIAGSMAPTIAIPVLAVVICINLARGGQTRERRIRLVAAGAILALVIVASMHLGL